MLGEFLRSVPLTWVAVLVALLCALYMVLPPRGLLAAGVGHLTIALYGIIAIGDTAVLIRVWLLHLAAMWLLIVMGIDLVTDDLQQPPADDTSVNARATRLADELITRTSESAVERSAAVGRGLGRILATSLEELLAGYDQARNQDDTEGTDTTEVQSDADMPHSLPSRAGVREQEQTADPRESTETSGNREHAGWGEFLRDESGTDTEEPLFPETGRESPSESDESNPYLDNDRDD